MNMKNIILFIAGVTIGGAAGVLGTKKYFKDKYQKQYENDHLALEEYYHRTDEYTRMSHEGEEEEFEDDGINSSAIDSRTGGRMSAEERAEIKKKLNKNWEGTTNYAGMYRVKDSHTEQDPNYIIHECQNCSYYDSEEGYCNAAKEHVNENDSCSDFELREDTPEEEAFEEHQKNKNRSPKIISADAYGDLPAHIDKEVLYFFSQDEMLTDENEEPVEEPERLVGDALTKYGFNENDETIIFVMNYSLDTCYEIQKFDSCWGDTH